MTSAYPRTPALSGGLMLHALARNWWLILLRGICGILFGVLTFIWPGITLLTLACSTASMPRRRRAGAGAAIKGGAPAPRWWLAVVGVLGIAVGILAIVMPG